MDDKITYFIDEEFDNDKMSSKISKLEGMVKKLNKENSSLTAKVNKLETIMEKICTQLNISNNLSTTSDNKIDKNQIENEIEETWLYYVNKGITSEKIYNALDMTSSISDASILDIKADGWLDEKTMLVDLLKSFAKFNDFAEDWSSMTTKQLSHYLQSILSSTLVTDTLIILRALPSKTDKNYDKIMANVATISGIMYNTWEDLDMNNELMGKMALVLESEEELQILNILKNNTRLILFVDSLFKKI